MSSQYDFDTIIDRHHTGAMKTDVLCERYGREDLIPLWIADMDFAVAPCITDALVRRLQHPVYGYADHLYPRDCQGHRLGSQCI